MNKGRADKIIEAWRGGHTMRFHTRPSMQHSVGQHSHGVAVLIAMFYVSPSVELLKAALFHDLAERRVGDLPYYTKRDNPALKTLHHMLEESESRVMGVHVELSPADLRRLKFFDMLELLLHSVYHLELGNTIAKETIENALKALVNMGGPGEDGREWDELVGYIVGPHGFNPNDYRNPERAEHVEGYKKNG